MLTTFTERVFSPIFFSLMNSLPNYEKKKIHHVILPNVTVSSSTNKAAPAIDYRCEDGRFSVSASCVTIWNPHLLSSSKTGVKPVIRRWKTLIWLSSMSESHWWYLFHKEVKSWASTTWFRIWKFQTLASKLYLQMHLLVEPFVFLGLMIAVFLKEGVKTYSMASISPLNSPFFFFFAVFTSIAYGSCWRSLMFYFYVDLARVLSVGADRCRLVSSFGGSFSLSLTRILRDQTRFIITKVIYHFCILTCSLSLFFTGWNSGGLQVT